MARSGADLRFFFLAQTHEVADAIGRKDFARAMELRDPDFTAAYDAYIESTLLATGPGSKQLPADKVCLG